jgi:hypothetical protein
MVEACFDAAPIVRSMQNQRRKPVVKLMLKPVVLAQARAKQQSNAA